MTSAEIVHLEIHTADVAQAAQFLWRLPGWRPEMVRVAENMYVTLSIGGYLRGGVVKCGARPAQWLHYLVVDRLDVTADRARELGAEVVLVPSEGPSGWRSVVNSPAAGMIALWQHKTVR